VVDAVVSAVSAVSSFYQDINPSTLSGAIDIVVVRDKLGHLSCSPFHARFGKLKLLRPSDKVVELLINDQVVDVLMKVGEAGEAFFVVEQENPASSEYATSPILYPDDPRYNEIDKLELGDGTIMEKNEFTRNEIRARQTPLQALSEPLDPTADDNFANIYVDSVEDSRSDSNFRPYERSKHTLEQEYDERPGITIASTNSAKPEMASSPPWSWQWGGLPEREKRTTLRPMVSTSVFDLHASSQMSIAEKVDTFFDGIEQAENPTPSLKVANEFDFGLDDINNILGLQNDDALSLKVEMSLCGPMEEFRKLSGLDGESHFTSLKIAFDRFCEKPSLLSDPKVIYKLFGYYHEWDTIAPFIMSVVIFKKPLSDEALKQVLLAGKKDQPGWFSWGPKVSPKPTPSLRPKSSTPNFPTKSTRFQKELASSSMKTEKEESSLGNSHVAHAGSDSTHRNYAKSLRLNSEQLKTLPLNKGVNTIQFSVVSGFQGKATCSARIFLWDWDSKVVISDIDGTITKSDVLGHVFTMVGRDWTHKGVASLYTNIAKNGYEFLYLTSRAIGQAGSTRDYLAKVEQDQFQLPIGPVLLSPDRLVKALKREVIQRRPQEFKISCLKDIKRLFGESDDGIPRPFYAGFGNRITDAMSYRSVDVPSSRIFTIDPSGDVKLELLANFKTTYVKLNETVDQVFPPTKGSNLEYGDFQYWKQDDFSGIAIDIPIEPEEEKENKDKVSNSVSQSDSDDFHDGLDHQSGLDEEEFRDRMEAMKAASY